MPNPITPLVPPDVDLRDFPFVPIYRARLFSSAFHAKSSDAEWRAGVTLWLKSWDQVPAGSLPTNDRELCHLAELGKDLRTWRLVKKWALHGWVLGQDGRLYHRTVSEGINEAWQRKEANRQRTEAATKARKFQRDVQRDVNVTFTKGQGQGQSRKGHNHKGGGEAEALRNQHLDYNLLPISAREGERKADLKSEENSSVLRSAPPLSENLKAQKKSQLEQKLLRYCNARLSNAERTAAILGLTGGDTHRSQQWWLDNLDARRKREGWDDIRRKPNGHA